MQPVDYIDRVTCEKVTESVMGDGALRFAYETALGRTLWPVLFGSKFLSALMGAYYDSRLSRRAIRALAAIPGCRADEAEQPLAAYRSFNDFFTRRLKPGARPLGEQIVSPADGRLRLYLDAAADDPFPLKGATKSLRDVCGGDLPPGADEDAPARYDIAVIRLAPVDYHRFHFPCDCAKASATQIIPGRYHSVNPIALVRYPDVYADNERHVTRYDTVFGDMWIIEVGAFGVGTIIQTAPDAPGAKYQLLHRKGDEKGYFKFGGSTVIVVTAAGKIRYDKDLVRHSSDGYEVRVFCGERIARPIFRRREYAAPAALTSAAASGPASEAAASAAASGPASPDPASAAASDPA